MTKIFGKIIRQSPKAILVETREQTFWVPKSLVEELEHPVGFDAPDHQNITVSDFFEVPKLKVFRAEVKKETEKAIQLVMDGKIVWMPKSKIDDLDYIDVGGKDCLVTIPEWLYKDKFGG